MLEIDVVLEEGYDEENEKFVGTETFRVRLEHSLFSVSKWEAVWEEVFLSDKEKTQKQTVSYLEMMILNENIPPKVFQKLVTNHIDEVNRYIAADRSATKIHNTPNGPQNREPHTSELIYYWMISMNIPVEFEHWHLNRLLTLVKVINLKNTPKKKMSASERQQLNRARLAKHGTKG